MEAIPRQGRRSDNPDDPVAVLARRRPADGDQRVDRPSWLEAARVFARYEVEGGVVVDVGGRRRDGYGAVSVALVVAAVEDDGHCDAATVGARGGRVVECWSPEPSSPSSFEGLSEAASPNDPSSLLEVGAQGGGGVPIEDAGVLVGGRGRGRGARPGWRPYPARVPRRVPITTTREHRSTSAPRTFHILLIIRTQGKSVLRGTAPHNNPKGTQRKASQKNKTQKVRSKPRQVASEKHEAANATVGESGEGKDEGPGTAAEDPEMGERGDELLPSETCR